MVYEYAHARRQTGGSALLRKIMSKFNKLDKHADPTSWGTPYCGMDERPLRPDEAVMAQHVHDRTLNARRAKLIIANIDVDKPFLLKD